MTDRRCGTCGHGGALHNSQGAVKGVVACVWRPTEPMPEWIALPIMPIQGGHDGTNCAAWKEKTE